MMCAWPKSHCKTGRWTLTTACWRKSRFQIPQGLCVGSVTAPPLGRHSILQLLGSWGRAAPGGGELLTPSVTTAKDFTASLEILGTVFPESFLFLMTFLVLAVTERHLEGKNTFLSIWGLQELIYSPLSSFFFKQQVNEINEVLVWQCSAAVPRYKLSGFENLKKTTTKEQTLIKALESLKDL